MQLQSYRTAINSSLLNSRPNSAAIAYAIAVCPKFYILVLKLIFLLLSSFRLNSSLLGNLSMLLPRPQLTKSSSYYQLFSAKTSRALIYIATSGLLNKLFLCSLQQNLAAANRQSLASCQLELASIQQTSCLALLIARLCNLILQRMLLISFALIRGLLQLFS